MASLSLQLRLYVMGRKKKEEGSLCFDWLGVSVRWTCLTNVLDFNVLDFAEGDDV